MRDSSISLRPAGPLIGSCLGALLLALTYFVSPTPVHANSIVVNSLADTTSTCATTGTGACTLRDAITFANSNAGPDTIDFNLTYPATITLGSALPPITDALAINGPGASSLAISGNNVVRVFDIMTTSVSMSGLTVMNGNAGPNGGGGINITGSTVTLTGMTLSNNASSLGGGINFPSGSLTISNCIFLGNSAGANFGGAIDHDGGILVVTNSTFINNSSYTGGAMDNDCGTLTVTGSTFVNNTATAVLTETFGAGGAIWTAIPTTITNSSFLSNVATYNTGGAIQANSLLIGSAPIIISNSTFISNTANSSFGGAIDHENGLLTIMNSTFTGNSSTAGGAIDNDGGTLIVSGGTFADNTAITTNGDGGAIWTIITTTVTNSTFFGNNAVRAGGAILRAGGPVITVTNSTFSGNSAGSGGAISNTVASLTFNNTIVASSPSGSNCAGTVTDGGNNLQYGDMSCGFTLTADPKLAPLGNYGGSTQTMALSLGSPAIDAANDAECPLTDQRGVARPVGAHCDIGAYEGRYYIFPIIFK